MKHRIVVLVMVLLVFAVSSVYAGSSKKIGTAGAQELLIPIGSRGTAMGGAVISNVSGVESIYWNPAGLASLEGTEAMFTHLPYIADIDVNFAGIATFVEGFGTIGLACKVVSIGDIEETTFDYPDGTGREFSPTLIVLGVTYSRIMTANVSFGITGNVIHEKIFEVAATGVAFDAGFIYDPRWNGVKAGFTIKNYGPTMRFSGEGFENTYEAVGEHRVAARAASFELPSSINIGMSYDFYDDGKNFTSVSGNFRSNNFSEDMWQGGAEYVYDDMFFLRGGYNFSDQDAYLYGVSFGAGLSYDLGGTRLTIEYAWNETDVFDDNQFFTFRANF